MGFTENVSEVMVVHQDTSHVSQSIIRGCFVREEKLVDLSIVHIREMGKSYALMKEIFGATSWVGVDRGLEERRAGATVSGDIKESVSNREWNLILPNTQSINGL